MNKKKIGIICGAAAAALAIGIVGWRAAAGAGQSGENPVYVNTVEQITSLGTGNGMVNRFAGVVEAQETWSVQQNSDKTVKEILVQVGDTVQKGTPLYTYDVEKFQEDLAAAQLELERMNNEAAGISADIRELEAERQKADADNKAAYTFQIQEQDLQLRQKQFDIQSKQLEIDKLNENIAHATVTSEIDGVVKSIHDGSDMSGMNSDNSFMTIMKTGAYRVKGQINEQNMAAITVDMPVLIHSRTDSSQVWKGTVKQIDRENPVTGNNMYAVSSSDGGTTSSSSYPFYVELESGEGLMLGQHVYLEPDMGQGEEKEGIWLDEYMIDRTDPEQPAVWADNGRGRLEKRPVTLGSYDENLMEYEILEGLELTDSITYPEEDLQEGMETVPGENGQMGRVQPENTGLPAPEDGGTVDGTEEVLYG